MRLVPLKSMKVVIDDKPLDAMVDSGAQIVLLNRSVLGNNASKIGEIRVKVFLVTQLMLISYRLM